MIVYKKLYIAIIPMTTITHKALFHFVFTLNEKDQNPYRLEKLFSFTFPNMEVYP